jgi:hypothetical protein
LKKERGLRKILRKRPESLKGCHQANALRRFGGIRVQQIMNAPFQSQPSLQELTATKF